MKLTVFGATGRTGLEIIKQAVERGYQVSVFVRNKDKLGELKSKVEVHEGDIMSVEDVSKACRGSDVVISAIGPTKDSQPGFQPRAIQTIITSMQQLNLKRLISMTGAGVRAPEDHPKLADKAIVSLMKIVAKKALSDGEQHAKVVIGSDLDWTIVRAPMLKDGPAKSAYMSGMVGDENLGISISRTDMASFILDTAEQARFIGKLPMVADKKN